MGTYEAIKRSILKNQAFEALTGQVCFQYFTTHISLFELVALSTLYFQWRFSQCGQECMGSTSSKKSYLKQAGSVWH